MTPDAPRAKAVALRRPQKPQLAKWLGAGGLSLAALALATGLARAESHEAIIEAHA